MDFVLILNLIFSSTVMASILVILISILKRILKNRISAKWHYIIWFSLILRLVVPYTVYSPLNLSDLYKTMNVESASSNPPVSLKEPDQLKNPSNSNANNSLSNEKEQSFSINNLIKHLHSSINKIRINYKLVFLIWILGVFVFSLYAFLYNIYFWTKVKNGTVFTDQKIIRLLEDCKLKLGVSTNISIIQTSGISIPAIFGVTRPWLLLPEKVLELLEYESIRYVILHEVAHLKRKDIIVNWIAFLLQIIHWFNPFIWLAFNKMRKDRELACDEVVLMHLDQGEEKKYGHTILDMVEIVSRRVNYAGISGILEDKSQVRERISMISRFKKRNSKLSVISVIIIILLTSSILVNASDFTSKKELMVTTENSSSFIESNTVKDQKVAAIPTVNEDNSLNENSNQVNEESKPPQQMENSPAEKMPVVEESKPQQQKENSPVEKMPEIEESKPQQQKENTLEQKTTNEVVKTTEKLTANGITQNNDKQIEPTDLEITDGITVTTDSESKDHTVYIYKDKLPDRLPVPFYMCLISADDISDDSIQSMVSFQKEHKYTNITFDGRSGEYYSWHDDNKKYSIFLLFDTDMNYLGYYTYQNP